MAYCLGSLVRILDQILDPDPHNPHWVIDHDKMPQIQSLLENASFLRDLFANSAPISHSRIEGLEDRIGKAAENLEDILESHITAQLLSNQITFSPPDLREVVEVFESAKEEMINIIDTSERLENNESPTISSRLDPNPKDMVVGLTQDLIQLRDRLTGKSPKLEIIPIVGMGGMGKSTLARILYDEYLSSRSHFDACAWVTLSQDYDLRGILLRLLGCVIGQPTNELLRQKNSELIVTLHKSLYHRRYLIVLDDIWSSKAWDDVQTFFPNDNKGSRIILTTRESDLANYVNSKSHEMRLLSQNDCWDLLRKKVYGKESCPGELEEVGKRIANNCRGLPLAVQVIGGLLSHAERSKEFWEQVSFDVSSFISTEDKQFSGIFSLSYFHLPHNLKPCLLYMGAFPEDYKIRASIVIKLWVAEGFLNPVRDKSLEESAKIYLKGLVERNLIFVRERKSNGEVKSYGMHDLLRDLCLKKAEEKRFFYVKSLQIYNLLENTSGLRRVGVYSSERNRDSFCAVKLTSLARSFRFMGYATDRILSSLCFNVSLLRVLDLLGVDFEEFPEEILKLVNLRYLALACQYDLPERISVLRNLQTLIFKIGSVSYFVAGLFDVSQLRHVKFMGIVVKDPSQVVRDFALHENLESLSTIPIEILKLVLGSIPNLKKLGISCDTSTGIIDLTCFPKLETLKCSTDFSYQTRPFLSKLIFPDSLKNLTLYQCELRQELNTIGMLPNLEILKLRSCIFNNSTWEPSEDQFCKLHYLELNTLNLVKWLADETHFPELGHLVILYCSKLNEIPLDIGRIATLEIIELVEFSPSVLDSANRILEEQRDYGNNLFELRLHRSP